MLLLRSLADNEVFLSSNAVFVIFLRSFATKEVLLSSNAIRVKGLKALGCTKFVQCSVLFLVLNLLKTKIILTSKHLNITVCLTVKYIIK